MLRLFLIITEVLCQRMWAVMEDFWSPLQVIIEELCLGYDKVWKTRKRVIGR